MVAVPDAIGSLTCRLRRLGLQTLAECVETSQQWHLLRDLGCDFFQGYLFDRGLEGEAFAAGWLC